MDINNTPDKLATDGGIQNTVSPIHNEVYEHKSKAPENSTGVAGLDHLYSPESRENFLNKEPLGFLLKHRQNKYNPHHDKSDSQSFLPGVRFYDDGAKHPKDPDSLD